MDNMTKQRTLDSLEKAIDSLHSVYYNMDEAKKSKFVRRADTIIVELLNLKRNIQQDS